MYCKKVCGDDSFSIDDWNEAFYYCEENNIEGEDRDRILSPEMFPCEQQCFDCMATVGQRRIDTKELMNKN